MTFKPLLAATLTEELFGDVKFPCFGAPKLDGLRALSMSGVATSRTMKRFPNVNVQRQFENNAKALEGLDGELIVGSPYGEDVYKNTQGPIMRREGEPDFTYWVFDVWDEPTVPYNTRRGRFLNRMNELPAFVSIVEQVLLSSSADLVQYEGEMLDLGYEGIMVRSIDGLYKYGRSRMSDGILMKLKRLADMEVEIVGYEEEMFNGNDAEKDAFGRTKRSSHQANKTGKGSLGAWVVKGLNGPFAGVTFNVGTGITAVERAAFWIDKEKLIGETATVRYFPIGSDVRPRHPRWKGFRDKMDFHVDQEIAA